MNATPLSLGLAAGMTLALGLTLTTNVPAQPKASSYWCVDDLRAGMKGHGLTVMKGTKIEKFDAAVLGVLKNTSPGRDLVLCRLSGLDLDKTGVIQGMSGSPVYIANKLVGAVAYAWAFGKEPIAGITPFSQMHQFVESYEQRDLAEQAKPNRIGLAKPLEIDGRRVESVRVINDFADPVPAAADGPWLVPLRTPLVATGFSSESLRLLRDELRTHGMVPMQGGAVTAKVAEEEHNVPLQAGGALTVAMVQGDFDVSGIGTVTHIEGKRVYGWGHPLFGMGECDFPLQTGYVHAIYPRQNLSFKMGSPLRTVGVINADVSTCIAGWLDRKPDLVPMRMSVSRESGGQPKIFNVQMVRHPSLMASLALTTLSNSVDMEGDLPEELTAALQATIHIEGRDPVVIQDRFSGSLYSGGRAPLALFSQVATVVNLLNYNVHRPVRITSIDCSTRIWAGRSTAEIEAVELDSETYTPGDTVTATVFLRPYKGMRQQRQVQLKLPADLPEGSYTATVCDDLANARAQLRDDPTLANPRDLEQLFASLDVQTTARRTNLVVRVPTSAIGVAINGKALPNLPASMVQILGATRRTGAQPIGSALVARQSTDWVVQGIDTVRFTVVRNRRTAGD